MFLRLLKASFGPKSMILIAVDVLSIYLMLEA